MISFHICACKYFEFGYSKLAVLYPSGREKWVLRSLFCPKPVTPAIVTLQLDLSTISRIAFYLKLITFRTTQFPHLIYQITFLLKQMERSVPQSHRSDVYGLALLIFIDFSSWISPTSAPHGLVPWDSHQFSGLDKMLMLPGLFGTGLAPSESSGGFPAHPTQWLLPSSSLTLTVTCPHHPSVQFV